MASTINTMIALLIAVIVSAALVLPVSSSTPLQTAYATWFLLPPLTNVVPPQMCDQAVAYDRQHARMFVWDGNDPNSDVVSDVWQFALTTFDTPEWSTVSLLPNASWPLPQRTAPLSVIRQAQSNTADATIYSFGGHVISTIIVPHDITAIQLGNDTSNNATYWNDFGILYPTNISDPEVASAADDPAVQLYAAWPEGRAWGIMEWMDDDETIAIMFGGTDEDGVDSAEVWLCNTTSSPPTWTLLNTTGDSPGKLSGHKSALWNNSLYIYGGYNCTSGGNSALGSIACFNEDVYVLPLPTSALANTHTYVWRGIHASAESVYWPERRAWHAMVQYDNKLWAFGGTYIDGSASQYFFNDVAVFDLINEQWMLPSIQGTVPPVMWSHTLTLAHDEFGIFHAILFGGCTVSSYYSDVYALKLNLVIQPSQVHATGSGLIQSVAGTYASFQLQTQNNTIITDNDNNTIIWTNILTWGIGLNFDVFIIGKIGSVSTRLESTITEIGEGLYNVSYLSYGGGTTSSSSCSSQSSISNEVVVSILLNNEHIYGSPFLVVSLPGILTANHTVIPTTTNSDIDYYSPFDAVKNQITTFTIIPADEYGNIAITTQDPSRVTVIIKNYNNDINNNNLIIVSDLSINALNNGLYLVSYTTPDINQYLIEVFLDNIQILSSPFIINPFNNLNVSNNTYIGIVVLAILCTIFIFLFIFLLIYYRKNPVFKASSTSFMSLILFGNLLIILSLYLPPITKINDNLRASCSANIWLLSIGFTLAFSSICMKTWRIKKIFGSNQLKIVKITDLQMIIPVIILIIIDIIILILWTSVNPLLPTDHISANNTLIHYVSCDGENSNIWLFLLCLPKIFIILYSIYLAISIRAVPNQFNESKMIGLAIYNVTFALIILCAVTYLLLSDQPTKKYVLLNIIVSYCVIITIILLFIPRLLQIYGYMETLPQQVNPVTSVMVIPAAMHSPIMSDMNGGRNINNNKKIKSFPSFPSRKKMLEHGENDLVERKKSGVVGSSDDHKVNDNHMNISNLTNDGGIINANGVASKSPMSSQRTTSFKPSVSQMSSALHTHSKRPSAQIKPQSPLLEQRRSKDNLPGSMQMTELSMAED